jgi:hypothetical protein
MTLTYRKRSPEAIQREIQAEWDCDDDAEVVEGGMVAAGGSLASE